MRRAVDSTAWGRFPRSFQAMMRFTAVRRRVVVVVEEGSEDEDWEEEEG